jgi:hypothetical protein
MWRVIYDRVMRWWVQRLGWFECLQVLAAVVAAVFCLAQWWPVLALVALGFGGATVWDATRNHSEDVDSELRAILDRR